MSQLALSTSPPSSHKIQGGKDTDPISVHAKLRSSKQQMNQTQTLIQEPPLPRHPDHSQSASVDEPQAEESTQARMTRKRAAHLANLEDAALHKGLDEVSKRTGDDSESPLGSVSQICLCQPDPKVPRPRNGEFSNERRNLLFVPSALSVSSFCIQALANESIVAAFILYRQRYQQDIIAQHPGLPNPEISKIAGERWRSEPEHIKNEWKLLAEVSHFNQSKSVKWALMMFPGRKSPTLPTVPGLSVPTST
jgi:hypothetical protein